MEKNTSSLTGKSTANRLQIAMINSYICQIVCDVYVYYTIHCSVVCLWFMIDRLMIYIYICIKLVVIPSESIGTCPKQSSRHDESMGNPLISEIHKEIMRWILWGFGHDSVVSSMVSWENHQRITGGIMSTEIIYVYLH